MYFRKPENQDQQKFWKMYIVTLACFLVIGIIPSPAYGGKANASGAGNIS
jgi:hypothetical protein